MPPLHVAVVRLSVHNMIEYKNGDILKSDAEALVNTVNCVGVMGAGIALHFKRAFTNNFMLYVKECRLGKVQPGLMLVYETGVPAPRYIINFPTKRHWRDNSRMEDIESGLEALAKVIIEKNIRSIAIPALGCGLGGLNWLDVKPLIEAALQPLINDINTRIIIYEPLDKA